MSFNSHSLTHSLTFTLTYSLTRSLNLCSQSEWSSHPFRLTAYNGYLYGRGVTDDKGPIIATLFAIGRLLVSVMCKRMSE